MPMTAPRRASSCWRAARSRACRNSSGCKASASSTSGAGMRAATASPTSCGAAGAGDRMAGTDHRRRVSSGGPAIILVEPQLGENIGAAARAMYNCGLTELRLVRPRDGWPSDKAVAMSSGAGIVLDHAQLFDTVEAALADLRRVYATTARDRFMVKRVVTPRQAAGEMRRFVAAGEGCGILFGPERAGLVNDHVALAATELSVPLNPAFSSLHLAPAGPPPRL